MKNFGKILVVSALSIVLIGCGSGRTREQKVSAMMNKIDSPFFVANTNLQNLMDKSEVMKEGTIPFTYYQVLTFFLAVELTGIDYSTDVQLIVGEGESFVPNFYGIFKVENEELFKELLETEANADIKEKDGMQYVIKDKEQYCLVWDKEFAIISSIPMDFAAMISGNGGKQGQKMIDRNIEVIKAAEDGEVDDDWVDFLTNESDISLHYDGEGFYSYMETMAMDDKEDMEKMKEMYEGMGYDMFINFDKGAVNMELVADLSDGLIEKLNFIGKDGVDAKLLNYGKSENPLMSGTYKVQIGGLMDYFEDLSKDDYEKMIEEVAEIGLQMEDIEEALSGDMVYMVDDISEKTEEIDFGYDAPIKVDRSEPNFAFVLGVSDMDYIQNTFQEMLAGAAEGSSEEMQDFQKDLEKIEMLPNGLMKMGDALVFMGADFIFASNDSTWANMVAAGTSVKINNPDGVLNEKPFGMYANFERLLGLESMKDGEDYIKMLESFSASANLSGGNISIKLTDASQNSLKVLTQTIGSVLAEFEKESNPSMEQELEEAVIETEDAFNKLNDEDLKEIEDAVNDAFDDLNE